MRVAPSRTPCGHSPRVGNVPQNEPALAGGRCAQGSARDERREVNGGWCGRRLVLRIEEVATSSSRQEPPMTEMAIRPLRRRMIEDMTVRNFVEKTRNDYIRHVKNLTAFLGRPPDTATAEDLRLSQLHLTEGGIRPPTINSAVSALRFFFSVTVDRPAVTKPLTFVAEPRKIPIVLSLEEVVRFLEAAPGPKYKAALSAAYGAGLRVWRASGHNLRAAEPGPEAHQRILQK